MFPIFHLFTWLFKILLFFECKVEDGQEIRRQREDNIQQNVENGDILVRWYMS